MIAVSNDATTAMESVNARSENGLKLHADFVSGHVDLAKKTGAQIVYGPTAKTDFESYFAKDGEAGIKIFEENIATLVAVEANSAPVTCIVPLRTAILLLNPSPLRRTIFSCTIMAASNTKPTEKANPARDITFKLRPNKLKARKATAREMGIVSAMIRVGRNPRKNTHKIPSASKTPMPKLPFTRLSAFLI